MLKISWYISAKNHKVGSGSKNQIKEKRHNIELLVRSGRIDNIVTTVIADNTDTVSYVYFKTEILFCVVYARPKFHKPNIYKKPLIFIEYYL